MNEIKQADTPAPFTEDETIVKKIGNTKYILTAKYKKGAKDGALNKLLRLVENYEN
jgi:hypothetical protein